MESIPTDNRRPARHRRAQRHGGFLAALAALLTVALPTFGAGTFTGAAVQSVSSIETAVHSYVESLLPTGTVDAKITVLPLDSRLRLAQCSSPLAAQLPVGTNLGARATIAISCSGPVHWSIYVPVVVESRVAVLVLRHPVTREQRLTADDVTLDNRRTAGVATGYLGSVGELAGRTVRRPLSIGTVLTIDMFDADLVVRRGQEVTLVAGAGGIEIRASGRAMSDAATGARIQVQNLSSMTVVEGVVESADVVRVAL